MGRTRNLTLYTWSVLSMFVILIELEIGLKTHTVIANGDFALSKENIRWEPSRQWESKPNFFQNSSIWPIISLTHEVNWNKREQLLHSWITESRRNKWSIRACLSPPSVSSNPRKNCLFLWSWQSKGKYNELRKCLPEIFHLFYSYTVLHSYMYISDNQGK